MGVEAIVDDLSHGHSIQVWCQDCDADLVSSVLHDSSDTGKPLDVELWHLELVDILVDVALGGWWDWVFDFRVEQLFTLSIGWNVYFLLRFFMIHDPHLALAER